MLDVPPKSISYCHDTVQYSNNFESAVVNVDDAAAQASSSQLATQASTRLHKTCKCDKSTNTQSCLLVDKYTKKNAIKKDAK